MEPYLIIYGFLFLSTVFDEFNSPKYANRSLLFFSIVFILFRGLRWNVGSDWSLYLKTFENLEFSNFLSYKYNDVAIIEPGYALLSIVIKSIGGNYTTFLLVMNGFIISVYAWFARQQSQSKLTLFALILATYPPFPVRQGLAAAILIFSYKYIYERKMVPFSLLVLIATTVHISAIAFIPFYFLLWRKHHNIIIVFFWAVCAYLGASSLLNYLINVAINIISFIVNIDSAFLTKLLIYSNITKDTAPPSIGKYAYQLFCILLFCWFKSRVEVEDSNKYNFFINLYVMGISIGNVFSQQMQEIARISDYFLIAFPVLVAYVVNRFVNGRYLLYPAIIAYMGYRLLGNTLQSRFVDELIPYKSIFNSFG